MQNYKSASGDRLMGNLQLMNLDMTDWREIEKS